MESVRRWGITAPNLLPLEILNIIIKDLPIYSLCSLTCTCRSLNNNKFITCAIDDFIVSNDRELLVWAALSDSAETMRRCLKINCSMPKDILALLAQNGCSKTLKVALEYGASVKEVDPFGYSSLGRAVRCGNVEGARVLLAAGAGWCGLTPLGGKYGLARIVRLRGDREMEELLLNIKMRIQRERKNIGRNYGRDDG
jgi:hypothetical protein